MLFVIRFCECTVSSILKDFDDGLIVHLQQKNLPIILGKEVVAASRRWRIPLRFDGLTALIFPWQSNPRSAYAARQGQHNAAYV